MMEETVKLRGPQVCAVGVNYSTTPIAVRERLGIPRARMQDALASLRDYIPKGVILATCNRTEIYAIDDDNHTAEQGIRRFLQDWAGLTEDELSPYLYNSRDYIAMRHLAKATSGLYSMILGEYEILGQVKQAVEDAEKAEMLSLPLRRLFQHAISTGRRVRHETDISKNALSVSSVAVDLAAKVTGNIHNCKVLLIGAGAAGKLVARALAQRGVSQICVLSRSIESARELATYLGGNAADINDLRTEMMAADIIITCTGSPHFVVNRQVVEKAMSMRDRSLVIVDIAVPRDVESEVEEVPDVFLYDIDALNEIAGINRLEREKEIDSAMKIVTSELEFLLGWWKTLEVNPTIGALMQMADSIRQQQLDLTLKKLPPLAQEDQNNLEAMTKSIMNKILQQPIQCLKNNGHHDGDFVEMVRELFALDEWGSI